MWTISCLAEESLASKERHCSMELVKYNNNNNNNNNETIPNNKPDFIIRNNEKGTCMLIDAVISGDRNVI